MPDLDAPSDARGVVVCGLGRLGQHCVAALKQVGVPLHGVDLRRRDPWEIAELPSLLTSLSIGDCRSPRVLEQAEIARSRAVLLVTRDERVNISAAFAVRSLHADIRIVIRSGQKNLNALLSAHLGNFAAFEPSELSAPALALAALADESKDETAGLFHLEGRLLRVVRVIVSPEHAWCGSDVLRLQTSSRRVIDRRASTDPGWGGLQQWAPSDRVQSGDTITYLELDGSRAPGNSLFGVDGDAAAAREAPQRRLVRAARALTWPSMRAWALRIWSGGTQTRRVVMASALVISSIYAVGTLLYLAHYPEIGVQDALNVGMVLILGGYDNLFGQLKLPFPIPPWLHVFSVLMSISGTVGIGILYAFLTERVLSVRLLFRRHRPPFPRKNHVVLIGTGPIGEQVAAFLRTTERPFIVLDEKAPSTEALLAVPYVTGRLKDSIEKVCLSTAHSVVALTDDEIANLEAALIARSINPRCAVIIRSDDASFSDNVAKLVAGARALGVYALAAEAFATAALGESVHSLIHIGDQVVVVVEYRIKPGDPLCGRLVSEAGLGFGVIPVLLQRPGKTPECFPSDDLRLAAGDRFVVLATKEALLAIEHRALRAPRCHVVVESAMSSEARFDGAVTMVRISGCDLATAQRVVSALPATLDVPLYEHQAERLVRELAKVRVAARWSA